MHVPVPPLVLQTPTLSWTKWMTHMPSSALSSWPLPLSHLGCCLSPTEPSVSGASVLVTYDEPPHPFLVSRPPAHATAALLEVTDDERFHSAHSHPVQIWLCVPVIIRFLFCAFCFLAFPPLLVPVFALDLPRRLVDVADAILGTIKIDLLLHK
jgi:hypothetical protein